jgi:hypothetical protein
MTGNKPYFSINDFNNLDCRSSSKAIDPISLQAILKEFQGCFIGGYVDDVTANKVVLSKKITPSLGTLYWNTSLNKFKVCVDINPTVVWQNYDLSVQDIVSLVEADRLQTGADRAAISIFVEQANASAATASSAAQIAQTASTIATSAAASSAPVMTVLGILATDDALPPFSGSTIADGTTVVGALQALETVVEGNMDTISSPSGAAVIGFIQAGVGAVMRSAQSKMRETVSLVDYGATGDGSDQTAAIQACLSANPGKDILVSGVYTLSATLYAKPNTRLIAKNPEKAIFVRTGDYDWTLEMGSALEAAGAVGLENIFFKHSDLYQTGSSLANPATTGGHVRIWGAQNCNIEGCYFWRLPYHIQFNGGSILHLERNTFAGTYDPALTGGSEGEACILLDPSTVYGNPKDIFLTKNTFLGGKSTTRNHTYTDSSGHSLTVSQLDNTGPKHALRVIGCETITSVGNYYGCSYDANVYLSPSSAGFIANARFVGDFQDGAGNYHIYAQMQSGGNPVQNLIISGCNFNGELNTLHHIGITAQGSDPSVYNATITGCTMNASVASPLVISGLYGGRIENSVIANYNCLGVTPNTDPKDAGFCAAGYITGASRKVTIDNVTVGGGGNLLTDSSNCHLAFYRDGAATATIGRVTYAGVAGRVGFSHDNPVFVTGTTYTANAFDRTLFCTNAAARAITLPTNFPEGAPLVVKDAAGTAATANITVTGGTFDGASSAVISTNKGVLRLKCAGGSVWYVM